MNAYERAGISRRKALGLAGVFMVAAACSPDKLFGPCQPPSDEPPIDPAPLPALRDVYIVDGFTGSQQGTKDNPYSAANAQEFDALMAFLSSDDALAVHLSGAFKTRGNYEWGGLAALGWRAGKYWQMDGDGEIAIDPNAIADSEITDAPLRVIQTREQLSFAAPDAMTAVDVWGGLPRGQAVRGLTLIGSHSALADRWKAKGLSLRTSGCLLQGHNAAIEDVHFKDFGALKASPTTYAETFPGIIAGAMGAPDRSKVAQLDPSLYVFDATGEPSHITGCTFDGYVPESSDDQVTVFMITGNAGEPAGYGTGNWKQHFRANCYQERNTVTATGKNLVQAHTIYQALRGRARLNRASGASMGYYGDYYATKGITIESNDFDVINHGVALYLSPSAADAPGLPDQFSHENYVIGPNRIKSGGANVSLNSYGATTPTRFIRGIQIDPSLSLENFGASDVRRESLCQRVA